MTTNPRLLLPALVLTLGLSLAACGGDDDGDTAPDNDATTSSAPETTPAETEPVPEETEPTTDVPDNGSGISKEELLASGNAICEAGNAAIEAASDAIDSTDLAQVIPFVTTVVVPSVRAQVEALRGLGYPQGDEETLSGIYDDVDALRDDIESDPEAVLSAGDPFASVNEALTEYGLTACGTSD